MRSKMHFRRLPDDDVVEASFDALVLETAEDAHTWAREVGEELSRLGGKSWLLINLDGLIVRPGASAAFGMARAEVLDRHAFGSVRYGGDAWTRLSIESSATIHQTHANVFATRDEALQSLRALRHRSLHAAV